MTKLEYLDLSLCILYLLSVLLFGIVMTVYMNWKRKTLDLTMKDYFLGGGKISWWALGIADVCSYIDIAGTMINTALIYALGVSGIFIEIRGGLCLMLAFQLAYTGKLAKRCPVITKGEWIRYRFGDGKTSVYARTTLALSCMIGGISSISYFVIGGGKFVTEFLEIPSFLGFSPEIVGAALLMSIALCYTVVAGFSTVVYTDVYQSIFMFSSFIYVAILAMTVDIPENFHVFLPLKNETLHGSPTMFLQHNVSKSNWISMIPESNLNLDESTTYSAYNNYYLALYFYSFKTIIRSSAGPAGGGLQTVLATKSIKEVRLQSFLGMVLLIFRWAFIAGLAVLGINYTVENSLFVLDPECVLPVVINNVLPRGLKGCVVSAIVAAGLTTFDSGINSTSSYWTVDIYKALINPKATEKQLLFQARLSSVFIMLAGLFMSVWIRSINQLWGFMTMTIGGGSMWPYFLAVYWGRFNAAGFCAGLFSGLITSLILFFFLPLNNNEFHQFLVTSTVSGVFAVLTTYFSKPVPNRVLVCFYKMIRPPGLWNQISSTSISANWRKKIHQENCLDLFSVLFTVTWQIALYLLGVSLVVKNWTQVGILIAVLLVLSPLLYRYWYCRLERDETPESLDELFVRESPLDAVEEEEG